MRIIMEQGDNYQVRVLFFGLPGSDTLFCQVRVKHVTDQLNVVVYCSLVLEAEFDFIVCQPEIGGDIKQGYEFFPYLCGNIISEDAHFAVAGKHVTELLSAELVHAVVAGFYFGHPLYYGDEVQENKPVFIEDGKGFLEVLPEGMKTWNGGRGSGGHQLIHFRRELSKQGKNKLFRVFIVVLQVTMTDTDFFSNMPDRNNIRSFRVV